MRDANAFPLGSVGTPLVAATFSPRAMRCANAFLDGYVGAPLFAASFPSRAMRDTNASPDSSVGAPFVAATFSPRPCVMQTPPLMAMLVHPSLLQFVLPIC